MTKQCVKSWSLFKQPRLGEGVRATSRGQDAGHARLNRGWGRMYSFEILISADLVVSPSAWLHSCWHFDQACEINRIRLGIRRPTISFFFFSILMRIFICKAGVVSEDNATPFKHRHGRYIPSQSLICHSRAGPSRQYILTSLHLKNR